MMLTAVLTAFLTVQGDDDKKKVEHIDKAGGFAIGIPPDKKLIRHWEFIDPKEGDNWGTKIEGDYANPLFLVVLSSDPPEEGKVYGGHQGHAESREQQNREEKTYKKVVRKALDTKAKFGKDKLAASHLTLEIEDENGGKFDKHYWCFQSGRNQRIYDVVMFTEPGLLEKKEDKDRVAAQVDYILSTFRTFAVKR